jgi:hypothetical protein
MLSFRRTIRKYSPSLLPGTRRNRAIMAVGTFFRFQTLQPVNAFRLSSLSAYANHPVIFLWTILKSLAPNNLQAKFLYRHFAVRVGRAMYSISSKLLTATTRVWSTCRKAPRLAVVRFGCVLPGLPSLSSGYLFCDYVCSIHLR